MNENDNFLLLLLISLVSSTCMFIVQHIAKSLLSHQQKRNLWMKMTNSCCPFLNLLSVGVGLVAGDGGVQAAAAWAGGGQSGPGNNNNNNKVYYLNKRSLLATRGLDTRSPSPGYTWVTVPHTPPVSCPPAWTWLSRYTPWPRVSKDSTRSYRVSTKKGSMKIEGFRSYLTY